MNSKLTNIYYTTLAHTFQHVVDMYDKGLLEEKLLYATKKLFGDGEIWDSGGRCMILSIRMPKVGDEYRCMHITDEVVTIYKGDTQRMADTLEDGNQVFNYEVK